MSELKTPKTEKCNDLHGFLKALPAETLEQLYNYPAICLAVYRETPDIAKQIIIRILFIEQPVPRAVVSSWCPQDNLASTIALSELKIWKAASIPGGLAAWELCPIFKENLKKALLGGGSTWSMFNGNSSTENSKNHDRDVSLLDTYAMSRWRCLLHYMVDSSTAKGAEGEGISTDAVKIILHANLMKRNADGSTTLTSEGFQFLLLDTQSQVWHFMLQYLNTCDQRNLNLVECLSMLFQLSFSTLGKDYTSDGLSANLLSFLQHLREFGLVYQRKRKHGRFYPTRLALNFTSKNAGGAEDAAKLASKESKQGGEEDTEGYIIVETNYRVYAYTDSKLQISLLGLFTEMLYRFPNVVVGVLTRDSIRQAFRGGINAKQIISYLEQHAHPRMLLVESSSKSILPPTVVDQIKLWENERNRFSFLEGVVYNQFLSEADFVTLRDYAQSITVLLWQNERTRTMVVTQKGNDDVKRYWKRYSKNAG